MDENEQKSTQIKKYVEVVIETLKLKRLATTIGVLPPP
jgi:hypothetical protein